MVSPGLIFLFRHRLNSLCVFGLLGNCDRNLKKTEDWSDRISLFPLQLWQWKTYQLFYNVSLLKWQFYKVPSICDERLIKITNFVIRPSQIQVWPVLVPLWFVPCFYMLPQFCHSFIVVHCFCTLDSNYIVFASFAEASSWQAFWWGCSHQITQTLRSIFIAL